MFLNKKNNIYIYISNKMRYILSILHIHKSLLKINKFFEKLKIKRKIIYNKHCEHVKYLYI